MWEQGQLLQREIFPQEKKSLSDSVSKNSHAESLMALGMITDVRVEGVLELLEWLRGREAPLT